jgi:nucleotide-binding universal stress UspA family protein
VVWGSRLILGFVNRYPVIVYLGAAVLAWTAAKMVTDEPLVKEFFSARPELEWALYVLLVGGVLGFGLQANRRARADRAWMPAAADVPAVPAGVPGPLSPEGGAVMKSILVPVDGSENSMNAVRHAISRHFEDRSLELCLLHVRQPLTRHISRFVSRGNRQDWHRARGEAAMARARALLDKWGVPYTTYVELGEKTKVIGAFASRHGCQGIVMGVSRESAFLSWLKGSVPARVVERAQVPVELIAGAPTPALQRYGLPAGIGLALTLFAIAEE